MQNPNHPPGKNIPTLHTKPSPPKRNNIHLPNLKHDQRKEQYQFQHSKLTEELTKQRHTSQDLRNEFKSKHRGENNSVIIPGGPGQQARVEISKEHKELHDMILVVVGDEGERERRRKEGEGESDGIEWSGECWWGTNNGRGEEDGTLYQILMEMGVHRVGFGIKSSWIVIGKNGEVAWKSIPN
eukprot:scaffold6616_cov76-Alexandrium_tamarense.AAC.1